MRVSLLLKEGRREDGVEPITSALAYERKEAKMKNAYIVDAVRTAFDRYVLCAMGIGAGQGIALMIERVEG